MKKVSDKILIDAIRKNAGIVSGILRTLKTEYGITMTRGAIYKRKESSSKIAEAFADAEDITLDIAESGLVEHLKGGNLKAIMFYLRMKGKKRGYNAIDTPTEQKDDLETIHFYFERPGDSRCDIRTYNFKNK